MRQEFLHARRIDVDIDDSKITVSGTTGTVTFIRRYQLTTVDGQTLDQQLAYHDDRRAVPATNG